MAGGSGLAAADAGKALVELRHLPARVHDALHAGPGRVGLRVDVQPQGIARLAVAGAGLELRAVRHDDVDFVILGVDVGFHGNAPGRHPRYRPGTRRGGV